MGQAVARSGGPGRHHRAATRFHFGRDIIAQSLVHVGAGPGTHVAEIAARPPAQVNRLARAFGGGKGRQGETRPHRQQAVPFVLFQIQLGRRHRVVNHARFRQTGTGDGAARVVIFQHQGVARLARFLHLGVERHHRLGHIGEQGVQAVMEQRQPVLHPGEFEAIRDGLVKRVGPGRIAEHLAIARTEPRDRGFVQHDLADRRQTKAVELADGALAHGIEGPDAFQFVAEKVQAHRLGRAGREQIDDTAAHRVFARLHHRVGTGIAVAVQKRDDAVHVHAGADAGGERRPGQHLAGRHALQQRGHGGQHHARALRRPRAQARQRVDAPRHHVHIRRDAVIGHAIPGGKLQHLDVGGKERQRIGHARHAAVVAGHMQHLATAVGARQMGNRQGIHPLGHTRDRHTAVGAEEFLELFQVRAASF